MSAPAIHSSSSSVSSSGQVDGLGRRVLAFDRETGGMLERLYLRPELAAFEIVLRGYIERLTALEDDRFARPLQLEHDAATGELTVVSQFVAGSRLSDLLDTAQDAGMAPGVDVALGYLLEALPAISTFHSKTGMTHGLIDPARTVVSAGGQVVFLDCAFGAAIERLGLSAARLWNELGIAAPPSAGRVRLDATADIAQVAMSAVMLVHGRRLAPYEYPDSLPSILMEIVEVAQIRRSSTFASSLQRILQRSLPLPGRRAFGTADEAIVEVRQLVRREIGLDVCRQALADFVAQMDAASLTEPEIEEPFSAEAAFDAAMIAAGIQLVDEEADEGEEAVEDADSDDEASSELELELQLDAPTPERAFATKPAEDVLAIPDVIEIDDVFDIDASDTIVPPFATTAPVSTPRPLDEWPDVSPAAESSTGEDEPETREQTPAPELSYAATSYEPEVEAPAFVERPPAADVPRVQELAAALPVQSAPVETPPAPEAVRPPVEQPAPPSEPVRDAAWERTPAPAAALEQAPAAPIAGSPEPALAAAPTPANTPPVAEAAPSAPVPERPASVSAVQPPVSASAQPAPEQAADADGAENASSRRRKRQQRSARARKDKLRSLTTDQQIAGAKPAQPPAQKSGAWIVSPDRAAAFEQAVQEPAPVAPVAPRPLVVPPAPTFPPPPPAPPAPPVASTPIVPVFNPPPPVQLQPKPIAPLSPPAIRPTPPPASGPLRLKSEPPSGYAPVRKRLAPDPPVDDRAFSAIPFAHSAEEEATRSFPWKLAAAALVLIAIAIVVGRAYIPSRANPDEAPETVATTAPADEPPPPTTATGGDIVIETQPAGVRVLLDGKPVGESPLKLPGVSAGRHVITFVTSSGEFKRTVRVAAGQTLNLDVPLYSGWVAIFAPIMLDVAENGRVIGNTEQNRLMLPPGAHKLTITNRELGYSTVKEVDIQAGEVYSVTLDPRGPVNFNAVPWGEVWLDNQKIGDTPIANFQVPLGVREFVFKHPQFGERRVTATVRADAPAAISVDFTKP